MGDCDLDLGIAGTLDFWLVIILWVAQCPQEGQELDMVMLISFGIGWFPFFGPYFFYMADILECD